MKIASPLCVVAAVLALATGSSALGASKIAPGADAVRVTDRLIDSRDLSGGRKVSTFLLYNRSITEHSIGHSLLYCESLGRGGVLGAGEQWCRAEFVLSRGALYAEGVIGTAHVFYVLAVVGGTGIYANVGAGSVSSSITGLTPRTDTIIAQLYAE